MPLKQVIIPPAWRSRELVTFHWSHWSKSFRLSAVGANGAVCTHDRSSANPNKVKDVADARAALAINGTSKAIAPQSMASVEAARQLPAKAFSLMDHLQTCWTEQPPASSIRDLLAFQPRALDLERCRTLVDQEGLLSCGADHSDHSDRVSRLKPFVGTVLPGQEEAPRLKTGKKGQKVSELIRSETF